MQAVYDFAYIAVKRIEFQGIQYRKDIGLMPIYKEV
jgi:phosphoribosylamine-glycine ligase|tara:strand:+ start:549 stop:656 length:108 start_codon:yes stop_codon:yes gene_type:complete